MNLLTEIILWVGLYFCAKQVYHIGDWDTLLAAIHSDQNELVQTNQEGKL